jgi:hypothetical protein
MKKMKKEGRDFIAQNFSSQKIGNKYISLYKEKSF